MDNDNNINQEYHFQLIAEHMSLDNCKECNALHTKDGNVLCARLNPSADNCIVIREFSELDNQR